MHYATARGLLGTTRFVQKYECLEARSIFINITKGPAKSKHKPLVSPSFSPTVIVKLIRKVRRHCDAYWDQHPSYWMQSRSYLKWEGGWEGGWVGGGGFHREICVLFIHENEKSLDDLTILENLATSLSWKIRVSRKTDFVSCNRARSRTVCLVNSRDTCMVRCSNDSL